MINNWLNYDKLILNTKKTVYNSFGNYRDSTSAKLNFFVIGEQITRASSYKYLGITFDANKKWKPHLVYNKKTKCLIFVFDKLKKILDEKTLMILYHALFYNSTSYGIIAWGGAYRNINRFTYRI